MRKAYLLSGRLAGLASGIGGGIGDIISGVSAFFARYWNRATKFLEGDLLWDTTKKATSTQAATTTCLSMDGTAEIHITSADVGTLTVEATTTGNVAATGLSISYSTDKYVITSGVQKLSNIIVKLGGVVWAQYYCEEGVGEGTNAVLLNSQGDLRHAELVNATFPAVWSTDSSIPSVYELEGYGSGENRIRYSDDFDESSAWTKVANCNLLELIEGFEISAISNGDAKITQTLSVSVKSGEKINLVCKSGGTNEFVYFWGVGSVNSLYHINLSTFEESKQNCSASYSSIGDGWYLLTMIPDIDISAINIEIANSSGSSEASAGQKYFIREAYTGDSYIPTKDYIIEQGVKIPLSPSNKSVDIFGNVATITGASGLHMDAVERNCLLGDGTMYLEFTDLPSYDEITVIEDGVETTITLTP